MSRLPQPKASLYTVGCRLNQSETAHMAAQLKADGYQLVEFGQPTDLLILNTCSVTDNAERDCRSIVRKTLRRSPNAFIAVTGCYAQTGKDRLAEVQGIDLIVGTQHKMQVTDWLPSPGTLRKQTTAEVLHRRTIDRDDFILPGVADYQTSRANLQIQDGCNFMCAFCIIPFARGHERSRKLDDLLREAEALAMHGHRELVLTGVNIGRYQQDGMSFLTLLERLETISSIERIRISSIEPTTIPDELLDYMATSTKLCPHLHIPLQSGDDGILRAMNRRYTVKDYQRSIEKAAATIPNLGLGTDVMVGFPGEGEREYSNTYHLCSDLPFSYLHVFSYSERPGTASLRLNGRVPASTIQARSRRLAALSRIKRLTFNRQYIGQKVRVLFEQVKESDLQVGLTGNYIRTGVRKSGENLTNTIQEVVISGTLDSMALGHLTEKDSNPQQ